MSEKTNGPAEHLIVGGGVIGLALAYELARRGAGVVLLERERPGAGATRAAGGMLAPISEAELEEPALIAFGQDSLRRYPEFVRGLERLTGLACGLETEGTLWVALDQDDLGELRHVAGTLHAKGLEAREIGSGEVRELEPHLSHRAVGGLLVPGDHQVDPRALSRALAGAIEQLGGRIEGGAEVEEIVADGGRVRGVRGHREGRPFERAAERVVLAAGAWSEELAGSLGPVRLGVRPVKGQLVRLRGPRLLRRVLRTPDVYLVPRADGELLIGATMEEMGFDLQPTAGGVMDLLRHGWEALPGIYDLALAEISVGLRSAVDDQSPVIGPAGIEGLFVALGHFRNGVLLAPATAHYLADRLIEGREVRELAPFSARRLEPSSWGSPE